jgi:hypothetical protein
MSKKKNIDDYIREVSIKHNFYYDYSLVCYKNAHTKIKIICPSHGIFEQTPINHKRYGCKKCGKLLSDMEILNRFKKIHGDKYDYTNFKYNGMYGKSHINCPKHGNFEQTNLNHLSGKGCPKCATNYKKDTNEIIKKLNLLHNNKYDYSLSKFKRTKDIISIICPKHKKFEQTLNNHLSGHGCPLCDESKGEKIIEKYLIENNIIYERQKTFEHCKDKNKLPFDFYLINYNMCIEYDGEQHFYKVSNWSSLDYTKKHDSIKNEFCISNKIKLCRISYLENIIEKLEKELKNNN